MRPFIIVLMAVVLPAVPLSASDGEGAPSRDDARLLLPRGPEKPTHTGWKDAAIEKLLDAAAGDDAEERPRALAKLRSLGLRAAIQARLREIAERDAARRARFVEVERSAIADRAAAGDALVAAAEALGTCGTNCGPRAKEFGTEELSIARNQAMLLHAFFVAEKPYGERIDSDEFLTTSSTAPFLDLPAAADLYQLAAKAYESAASATDAEIARACAAKAVAAHADAVKARKLAKTMN